MLFGPKTEKKDEILKDNEPEKKDKKPPKPKKKKKGHGKIPGSSYTGADRKFISHEELKPKDSCPLCPNGKVYPIKKPGIAIYLKGQPPIDAMIYELEKLRCNLCGKVFTAAAPEDITGKYYDETARAMMAILKYAYGFPWYRLERLAFHQVHSGSKMNALRSWLDTQFKDKLVEPNSGLFKAITYMIKLWKELTQFLRVPGAPLDNNICEQGLKRCILHRKNSLFYRTEHGAYIGDMFMSLIHTCNLMNINSFDYLVALQKNSAELFKNPSQWMPWNYEANIAIKA